MIITLSGMPGSGKSTVGKILAKRLGYHFYSLGDLYGEMATARGMTVNELLAQAEHNPKTDHEIDEYQRALGAQKDNIIVDSRLAYHFIPHSFKVFFDVDPTAAAARVFAHRRADESITTTPQEMQRMQQKRLAGDARRYRKHYGIIFPDRAAFDLILDTTNQSPEILADQIVAAIKP